MDAKQYKKTALWTLIIFILLILARTVYVFIATGGLTLKDMAVLNKGGAFEGHPIIIENATDFRSESVEACRKYIKKVDKELEGFPREVQSPLDTCLVFFDNPKVNEETHFAIILIPWRSQHSITVVSSTIKGSGIVEIKLGAYQEFNNVSPGGTAIAEGTLVFNDIRNNRLSNAGHGEIIAGGTIKIKTEYNEYIQGGGSYSYVFLTPNNKILFGKGSTDTLRREYLKFQAIKGNISLRTFNRLSY